MDQTKSGPRIQGSLDHGTSGRDGENGVGVGCDDGKAWQACTEERGFGREGGVGAIAMARNSGATASFVPRPGRSLSCRLRSLVGSAPVSRTRV